MSRVSLTRTQRKNHKLKDLKTWVKSQMAANDMTQDDVGEALGIPQSAVSVKLKKSPKGKSDRKYNPDPFSYGDILILCELFNATPEEKARLLSM